MKRILSFLLTVLMLLSLLPAAAFAEGDAPAEPEISENAAEASEVSTPGEEMPVADSPPEEEALADAEPEAEEAPADEEIPIEEEPEAEEAPAGEEIPIEAEVVSEYVSEAMNEKTYAIELWLEQVKAVAAQADYVITPNMGQRRIIIEPGETVATYPLTERPAYNIQGYYISNWRGNKIWQLDDPQVDTSWLVRSEPQKLSLTPMAEETMPIVYGDRLVDKPDDPVVQHEEYGDGESYLSYDSEGRLGVTYVSLYKNETGLPIIIDFGDYESGHIFGKIVDTSCVGKNKDGGTNFQGGYTVYTQPKIYFAEPWYTLTVNKAEIVTGSVDLNKLIWAEEYPDNLYTAKLYVDHRDHTYLFPCPKVESGYFMYFADNGSMINPSATGARDSDVFAWTFNMQTQISQIGMGAMHRLLADQNLNAHFGQGDTVCFDPMGGSIEGDGIPAADGTLFVEVCPRNTDSFNISVGSYVPVREGYTFLGWYTDPDKPTESLITDTDPAKNSTWHRSSHTDLYAAWALNTAITTQPANATLGLGETATFTVGAAGTNLKYQWQYIAPGGAWANWPTDANTDTLSVPATQARSGYKFRCRVAGAGGTVYSAVAKLIIATKISTQPAAVTTAYGNTASFTVKAVGTNLQYQWQAIAPGGAWQSILDDSIPSAKTATLTLPANDNWSGYKFRCRVVGDGGAVFTSVAKLTITTNITSQPAAVTTAYGNTASFTVNAVGTNLQYQWQAIAPGGAWKSIIDDSIPSAKTATLKIPANDNWSGYKFRCRVAGDGGAVFTNVVKLTITTKINTQPANATANSGKTAAFTVKAVGTNLQYQWQYIAPGGTWQSCTEATAKSVSLNVAATAAKNGYKYRCRVVGDGGSVYTSVVKLTVK